MAEKPILFSTEMIRAILAGKKTQTRRVVKPQPKEQHNHFYYDDNVFLAESGMQSHLFHNVYGDKGSPYGSVYGNGDIDTLWVRETWQAQNHSGQWWHEVPKGDRPLHNWAVIDRATPDPDLPIPPRWMPSIFMPRWASRLTLQVVDVRIERVQEISKDDAIAEGLDSFWVNYGRNTNRSQMWRVNTWDDGGYLSPIEAFEHLWDSINAKRGYSWQSNPWVWVVEFTRQT